MSSTKLLNETYKQTTLSNLDTTAQTVSENVTNASQFLKNVSTAVEALVYNKNNLVKTSLSAMPDMNDVLSLRKSTDYKDIINDLVVDTDTVLKKYRNILSDGSLLRQSSSKAFLQDTLNKLKEKETQLKTYVNAFVRSSAQVTTLQQKMFNNLTFKNISTGNFELAFVTLLKIHFVVFSGIVSNEQLKVSWRLIEPDLFQFRSNADLIKIPELTTKLYLNDTNHKTYFYFDKIYELTLSTAAVPLGSASSISQKNLSTDAVKSDAFFNFAQSHEDAIGVILNKYLLNTDHIFAEYHRSSNSSINTLKDSIKHWNYPIRPISSKNGRNSLPFVPFSRPRNSNFLGAGSSNNDEETIFSNSGSLKLYGSGNLNCIQNDDCTLTYNGKGEYNIRLPDNDDHDGIFNLFHGSGSKKRRRRKSDTTSSAKKQKNSLLTTSSNTELNKEIINTIKNMEVMKGQLLSSTTIDSINAHMNIYMLIDLNNRVMSMKSNAKNNNNMFVIIKLSDIIRAKNHLNFAKTNYPAFQPIFDKFENELKLVITKNENELKMLATKSKNATHYISDMYLKSNTLLNIYNTIENLVSSNLSETGFYFILKTNIHDSDTLNRVNTHFTIDANRKTIIPIQTIFNIDTWIGERFRLKFEELDALNRKVDTNDRFIKDTFTAMGNPTITTLKEFKSFFNKPFTKNEIKSISDIVHLTSSGSTDYKNYRSFLVLCNSLGIDTTTIEINLASFRGNPITLDVTSKDFIQFLHQIVTVSPSVVSGLNVINYAFIPLQIQPSGEAIGNLRARRDLDQLLGLYRMCSSAGTDVTEIVEELTQATTNIKTKMKFVSNFATDELQNDVLSQNITSVAQNSAFDVIFKKSINQSTFFIGPSGSGKSVMIFGINSKQGFFEDILNMNNINTFYIVDWYAKSLMIKEFVRFSIQNPKLNMITMNATNDDFIFHARTPNIDYTKGISKDKLFRNTNLNMLIEKLKNIRIANNRIQPTINNNQSSRSILMIFFKYQESGRTIFKTIYDLPGQENMFGAPNMPLECDFSRVLLPGMHVYSKLMDPFLNVMSQENRRIANLNLNWGASKDGVRSNPCLLTQYPEFPLLEYTTKALTNPIDYERDFAYKTEFCFVENFYPYVTKHTPSVVNKTEPYYTCKFNAEMIAAIDTCLGLAGLNNTDTIEPEFWQMEIDSSATKSQSTNEAWFENIGMASSAIKTKDFFLNSTATVPTSLSFLYSHLNAINILAFSQSASNEVYLMESYKSVGSLKKNNLFEIGSQNLIVDYVGFVVFFVTSYLFYLAKKNETSMQRIENMCEIDSDEIYSRLMENVVIIEILNQVYSTSSSTLNKYAKNVSVPFEVPSQLYFVALSFRTCQIHESELFSRYERLSIACMSAPIVTKKRYNTQGYPDKNIDDLNIYGNVVKRLIKAYGSQIALQVNPSKVLNMDSATILSGDRLDNHLFLNNCVKTIFCIISPTSLGESDVSKKTNTVNSYNSLMYDLLPDSDKRELLDLENKINSYLQY